jgi:hypothetical protein
MLTFFDFVFLAYCFAAQAEAEAEYKRLYPDWTAPFASIPGLEEDAVMNNGDAASLDNDMSDNAQPQVSMYITCIISVSVQVMRSWPHIQHTTYARTGSCTLIQTMRRQAGQTGC